MAEPTEPRVNKAFVVPDTDRPAIDPGASDVADQSYERIEQIRVERALAGDTSQANAQRIAEDEKLLNATGTSEDRSYDSIEAVRSARADTSANPAADSSYDSVEAARGARADTSADSSYDQVEAIRAERAAGGDATPTQTVDTPPSGRDLMTGAEDPGVIESMRLDRWELDQADVAKAIDNYDAGEGLHAEHSAEIHASHGMVDVPATPDDAPQIQDGFTPD